MTVRLRAATMDDWARLFYWRNHQTTREQFHQTEPVGLAEHLAWLKGLTSETRLFVAVDTQRGAYVGTVRLDLLTPKGKQRKDRASVSITVDPASRGRGYAPVILGAVVAEARLARLRTLVAEVRVSNAASLRAFADAGYDLDGDASGEWVTLTKEVA